MKKRFVAEIMVCIVLVVSIIAVIIGNKDNLGKDKQSYDDGIKQHLLRKQRCAGGLFRGYCSQRKGIQKVGRI